jgi:outer membrane protein OmpA-like peptidoglycan-associated protein
MMRRFVVVPVIGVACLAGTGCLATRDFVRENLQQSETKTGQELTRVETQVGETRTVADRADKQANEATRKADEAGQSAGRAMNRAEEGVGLAGQAQTKADQTDTRLSRLWSNRNKQSVIETVVVTFGFDRWQLDDRADTSLLEVARLLNENPNVIVNIEGYTDNSGPSEYNLELSRRRAEAVRRSLVAKGVDLHRVQTIGLGDARPAAPNTTKKGRDQNRRVAIKVLMPAD